MRELKNAIFALLLCFVMAACSQGDGQDDARTAIDSIADKAMAMTDSVLNDTREKSQGVQKRKLLMRPTKPTLPYISLRSKPTR